VARAPTFDLASELARPGFTPARTDAPALVELIATGPEGTATRAMPALAGLGEAGREAIVACLAREGLEEGAAARVVQALGLHARAGDADARARLIVLLGDERVRVRRASVVALGKLGASGSLELREGHERRAAKRRGGGDDSDGAVVVELRDGNTRRTIARRDGEDEGGDAARLDDLADVRAALIARWDAGDVTPDERRALAEALGKIGGEAALARLSSLDARDDKELARRRDRALLMADRTAKRGEDSEIAIDVAPPRSLTVRLGCRPALGELLRKELEALHLGASFVRSVHQPEWVEVVLTTPWSTLHASRLWATAAIVLPLDGLADRPVDAPGRADEVAAAIVRTLTSAETRALLSSWTRGAIRWRLGMVHGHQRALVWRVAKEVTARAPELVNDPTATTWDVQVDPDARTLLLIPRRIEDPRFAYRVAEVPAASTGSVAAALVWAAEARAGDRVWDPFCGSGVELVECARRAPVRSLLGTDIDPAALDAARANLAAAGVTAELALADARTHQPGAVDLIVTNPPLGSRVHVAAGALLVEALPNLARALAPKGRLVWITPSAKATTPAATALGLELGRSIPVDLGGVRGRLERWNKR
jgi:SAM-dependent methyltransferase